MKYEPQLCYLVSNSLGEPSTCGGCRHELKLELQVHLVSLHRSSHQDAKELEIDLSNSLLLGKKL